VEEKGERASNSDDLLGLTRIIPWVRECGGSQDTLDRVRGGGACRRSAILKSNRRRRTGRAGASGRGICHRLSSNGIIRGSIWEDLNARGGKEES